jgi:hypothetical protein
LCVFFHFSPFGAIDNIVNNTTRAESTEISATPDGDISGNAIMVITVDSTPVDNTANIINKPLIILVLPVDC